MSLAEFPMGRGVSSLIAEQSGARVAGRAEPGPGGPERLA